MPNRRGLFGAFGRRPPPTYPVGPGAFITPEGVAPEPLTSARVGVERPFRPMFPAGPGAFIDPGLADNSVDREPWRSPADTGRMGVGDVARVGGTAPPSATWPDQSNVDNQAWIEAMQRAREGIAQEGYPYMSSPSWVMARTGMDRALDRNRTDRAEQERRERVSFDSWWHWGGRQGNEPLDPNAPAYRFNPPPRRNGR